MSFIDILGIAVSLAMDAFAVSLGAGTHPSMRGFRSLFRVSFHFGLFQFLMPLVGWAVGIAVAGLMGAFDHWVAFALLALVGGHMIQSGFSMGQEAPRNDPSRGMTLLALSIATSIDALAIGLTLAMMRVNIWYPSVVIGIVTGALSILGVLLGKRLSARLGQRTEIIGGAVLILIGLRLVYSHFRGP
jgi:manganese efflux pump family protein